MLVPDWVKEFRETVEDMSYVYSQSSLDVLMKTRKGNCEAFAKLAASIADKYSLYSEVLIVEDRSELRLLHALVLIQDYEGERWCVSNEKIYPADSISDAIQWDPCYEWELRRILMPISEERYKIVWYGNLCLEIAISLIVTGLLLVSFWVPDSTGLLGLLCFIFLYSSVVLVFIGWAFMSPCKSWLSDKEWARLRRI